MRRVPELLALCKNSTQKTELPISEPLISMKVCKPSILTGILALKVISNKYKYVIFTRELDAQLYAQSSFQAKVSD